MSRICPITNLAFVDPVIDEFGHTYERSAITTWMTINNKSPITREIYQTYNLIPNYAILVDTPSAVTAQEAPQPPIVPNIHNCYELNVQKYGNECIYYVSGQQSNEPIPVDVVLVIDKSGSMDSLIAIKDQNGSKVENGLTSLDIVKHASETIIRSLGPRDRLSVIAYDEIYHKINDLVVMTTDGHNQVSTGVKNLKAGGGTNIYGGIKAAIEILASRNDLSRNPHIVLLTDGQPNLSPSQGETAAITEELNKRNCIIPIHTFGFGSDVISKLLYDISTINNAGMYCYIPDGSMVGTIFINAISNIRCMASSTLKFSEIKQGPVYLNRKRSVVTNSDAVMKIDNVVITPINTDFEIVDDNIQIQENKFACFLNKVILILKNTVANVSVYVDNISLINTEAKNVFGNNAYGLCNDVRVQKILETVNDQIALAFDTNYRNTWGLHYVRSVIRSLELQIKNNFKDAAVSIFTDSLFEKLCSDGDTIFNTISPPVASVGNSSFRGGNFRGGSSSFSYTPVVSMQSYNMSSNPCFIGTSMICCVNNSSESVYKQVQDLKKNDIVWTPSGPAKIVCVLKTLCTAPIIGHAELVRVIGDKNNELFITPNHPVMYPLNDINVWILPKNIPGVVINTIPCDAVYSLILDHGHIVEINGFKVICLGHGFSNPKVLEHDYFGTKRVINDLSQMVGWDSGLVVLKSGCIVEDGSGGIKLIQN